MSEEKNENIVKRVFKRLRVATPPAFIGYLRFQSENQVDNRYRQITYKMKVDFVGHFHSLRFSNPITQPFDHKKSPAVAELTGG